MDWHGGSAVADKLKELREYLYNYFGTLNEVSMLGYGTSEIPAKPEVLIRDEQCQALGLPLVAGGVIDQPYIWMQELAVLREVQAVFRAMEAKNQQQPE